MSADQIIPVNGHPNVHRLALGTVQFGLPYGIANTQGQVSLTAAESMVTYAANCGVDTIDTAIGYGDSEKALGQIGVQNFKVISKLLAVPESTENVRDWMLQEVEHSLMRLNLNSLYGLLLHRPDDLLSQHGDAIFEALCELKDAGKVQKIGVSIYSPSELDSFAGKFGFDLIQAPFNLVDRRLSSSGWLQRLKAAGCEVHIRSAFLQGLLLMPQEAIPAKFSKWAPLLSTWHQWLKQYKGDAVSACLAYPLSFPEVDRVVVGANDLAQLQQIVAAAGHTSKHQLPDLACEEESLINPAKWPGL